MGARACETKDVETPPPPSIDEKEIFKILETKLMNSPASKLESTLPNKIMDLDTSSKNVIDLDDDQEEGEIVDDFEEIISSDEELVIGQRIMELELQNVELGKIVKTSTSHNYDYYKPHLAINLVSDSDNEYLEYSYYDRIAPTQYPKNSHRYSNYQLNSKQSENKRTKKSKSKRKYNKRQNEDEYEIDDYSSSRRHRHHKLRRKSSPSPKRNSSSRSPIYIHESKRKYEKTRSISVSSISLSSSDEEISEISKLNRDQLRIALNGDSKKPRKGNFKNFRKKIKTEADAYNIIAKNTEQNVQSIKEDESDDSVTLEEQELRLIALKSAVVQKHLKRKQRQENEKPYSPSDFVDQIIQNIPSPKTIGNSPVASPIEGEDILLSEDMELVNSNSDSNDGPVFLGGDTIKNDFFQPKFQQNFNGAASIENMYISNLPKSTSDDENSKLRIISTNRSPDPNDEEECALRTLLLAQKKTTKTNIDEKEIVDQKENNSHNRIMSNMTPPNLSEADISDLREMILENIKTINNRTNSVLKEAVKRLKKKQEDFLPKSDEFGSFIPIENPQNVIVDNPIEYSEKNIQPTVTENSLYVENLSQNDNLKSNLINSTNYLVPDQNLVPVSTFYPKWPIFPQNPILPTANQLQYSSNSSNIIKPVERSALKVIPLIHQNDQIVLSNKNSNLRDSNKDDLKLPLRLENSKSDLKTTKNEILRSRLNELENEICPEDVDLEKGNVIELNSLNSKENGVVLENDSQIETEENTSSMLKNTINSMTNEPLKINSFENNVDKQNINDQKTIQQNESNRKIETLQNLCKSVKETLCSKASPAQTVEVIKPHEIVKSVQKLTNLPTPNKIASIQLATKNLTSKKELSRKFTPTCPKVQKLIININASSETDSDNFDLDLSNCTNDQCYDDNASPMSFQMDSPCYSPLNVTTKLDKHVENVNNESVQNSNVGVAKCVVNDLFEAKLNEFLKTARTNVDKAKTEDSTTSKTKSSSLKSSLAVCHLPKSAQDEYKKLLLRMKLLEKQKNLKIKEKNKIVQNTEICTNLAVPLKNFKVTIKNDAPTNCSNSIVKINNTILSDIQQNHTITKTIVNDVALLNCIENQKNIEKNSIKLLSNSNKNNLGEISTDAKLDTSKTEDKHDLVKNDTNLQGNEYEDQTNSEDTIKSSALKEKIVTQDLILEHTRKANLLERYEQAYEKNGTNILSNLNKAIDLINLGKQEKGKKIQFQLHLEQLKKECEKYEEKIQIQNKKISKIYPEISNSHRILTNLRARRVKLNKVAKNLGKIVKGDNYSVKDDKKLDISTKFKDFSNGITILKNFNINDIKNLKIKLANTPKTNLNENLINEKPEHNLGQSKNNLHIKSTATSDSPTESIVNSSKSLNISSCDSMNTINNLDNKNISKYDANDDKPAKIIVNNIENHKDNDIQYSIDCLILNQDSTNKKKFMFNGSYKSPLEYHKSNFRIDSNAILCPFQLKGLCDDSECKFQHLY